MDPFSVVLSDAESSLQAAKTLLARYEQDGSPNTLADIQNTMKELTETVHDLSRSIAAVQREPERFNINATEVSNRIAHVGRINGEVTDIQEALELLRNRGRPLGGAGGGAGIAPPNSSGVSPDPEIGADGRSILYAEAIQEQDAVLDSVYDTVTALREQANVMGYELEDQAVLLDDLDRHVDSTGDRLRRGLKKVDWVLKNNRETLSSCCITLLIIALVVLLVLVLIL